MREIDEQLGPTSMDLVIAPVGVGSFAQAVTAYAKAPGKSSKVLTVEPDTAACLWKSLSSGSITPIETSYTTMAGLDCGTVSTIAWPVLRNGVDASATVSDYESQQAERYLESLGVFPGPCGAAPLAALRRLNNDDRMALGLNEDSTVVLLCTEGSRDFGDCKDVAINDPVSLTQALVQINSAVPGSSSPPGPGETQIARYIAAWLQYRDIETHWLEPTAGRPSVVGVIRGTGGGKSLMLNGHIDTVTTRSYDGDPLSGGVKDGKLYGRGAADMKGGVAASLIATASAKNKRLKGDVIFAGVADEEDLSIGTEQLLSAGWRADGAIICEPTNQELVHAHKGFVWLEVDIHGVAAHGSRYDLGVDAITRAGYFLVELDHYSKALLNGPIHPLLGPPSVHASIVKGGEEPASYPAKCTVSLEKRTLPGETAISVKTEIETLLKNVAKEVLGFIYEVRATFSRPAFEIKKSHPFVSLVADGISAVTGGYPAIASVPYWTDCALLSEKGIPVVLYGAKGEGLHAKEEWVEVQSIHELTSILTHTVHQFCNS